MFGHDSVWRRANQWALWHVELLTNVSQRHKIENVFGRIKDWRRAATRYNRCAHTFMSAISIAATCCY
jgi:transposase